eukprot:TRINITY_DN30806_c0_g1_i1.p1 TRINITY_DN30806_c0_g1~~TRINITY_DN30806_c0_g1_i1.p1  ORF type:complete len:353 (+),score=128.81 TRINITY_DN30806_c0_g1_i1:62-1120(+)
MSAGSTAVSAGSDLRHTRVTNWTLESAGSSVRRQLSPRLPSSLRTDDIAGATSGTSPIFRALRYRNKPCGYYNNDIEGSTARRVIPDRVTKRNDFNISNADIEHSSPESKSFKTKRVLDPLNPVYTLSSHPQKPATPPPLRTTTCRTDDIDGTAALPLHRRPQRDHINYSDVPLSQAGALLASRKRTTEGLSLVAQDINHPPGLKGFETKRCTNPLQPKYQIHVPPGIDPDVYAASLEVPGSRPKQIRPQRSAAACSLSLRCDDVEGAQSRVAVPFPQRRRQWRATCHTSDIPSSRPAGRFHKMHGPGSRCTDPCNPRYQSLDTARVKLPPADTPPDLTPAASSSPVALPPA